MFNSMANHPEVRNLVRNLINGAASKNFPGAQRNTTIRDSMAFAESPQTGKPALIEISNGGGVVGTMQADE
jgi:hypothetical protein